MSPTICPDSEGEDDEVLYDQRQSQRSTFSWAAEQAEAILAQDVAVPPANLGGGSTSSSDLLGQIQDARLGLFATASGKTSAITAASQRRRTTFDDSTPNATPSKGVKRTKTTDWKACSSRGSNNKKALDHDDSTAFARTHDAFVTSQSADSAQLPACDHQSNGPSVETTERGFLEHEPNVMFRDSCDTNAFTESSQLRMVELARVDTTRGVTDTASNHPTGTGKTESSSFPWSASAVPTQSSKSNQSKGRQSGPGQQLNDEMDCNGDSGQIPRSLQNSQPQPSAPHQSVGSMQQEDIKTCTNEVIVVGEPLRSSPVVEIPRYEGPKEASPDVITVTTQKSTRGRKRKPNDRVEDSLNSDDQDIGMPKEQYNPRPSRRRATQIVEAPVDYSVVPEKATRKRRKTVNGKIGTDESLSVERAAQFERKSSPQNGAETAKCASSGHQITMQGVEPSAADTPSEPGELSKNLIPDKINAEGDSPQQQMASSLPPSKTSDDKSMAPPPVPSASFKKGRRSKTTIFEDHVVIDGAHRSPSLRQQQAMRKSALEEIRNDSSPGTRRKRRTIVQEDEDEEDELAKSDFLVQEPLAKKRGRPSKNSTAQKSARKVVEDSESEEEDALEEVDVDGEDELPPKKDVGRPRKAKADEEPKPAAIDSHSTATQSEQVALASSDIAAVEQDQSSPSRAALARKDSNRLIEVDETVEKSAPPVEEPPSPRKAGDQPSPTSHSPIKGSSLVPLRVGLSKKRKIPPLLKSFRPPPKQSTR